MPDLARLLAGDPTDVDPPSAVLVGTVVSADASGIVVKVRGANSPKLAHVQPLASAPAVGTVVAIERQGAQMLVLGAIGDSFAGGSNLVGELRMVAIPSTPPGWLECAGAVVSRTTYAALFAAIGTAYGPGDGSTTFHLPDFRGRVPVGVGAGSGGGVTAGAGGTAPSGGVALLNRVRGMWGGRDLHVLATAEIPAHTHAIYDPGHTHSMTWTTGPGGQSPGAIPPHNGTVFTYAPSGVSATTGIGIYNTGGDGSHPNDQPWLAVRVLIYASV